jgi:hypothetical protein
MAINDMMIMELVGILIFSSRCLSIFMACEIINVPYYTIEVKLQYSMSLLDLFLSGISPLQPLGYCTVFVASHINHLVLGQIFFYHCSLIQKPERVKLSIFKFI